MKNFLLFLVFAVGLLTTQKAQATHLMGSDIVYKCLGNGKYEIVVRVYRDCNGVQISQSNVLARCSSTTLTISQQTKVSVRDITGIDANCPTQSRCAGSSFQYGVEEHIWSMEIDLSSYQCCEWTLSWEQSARNSNITTGAANQNFYATATLNKCVTPCNSSPDFTNPPVAIICQNQDFVFNNGALDTIDVGDSLSYELVNGFQSQGTSITYSGNFSPVRPLTFFGFPNQNLQWPAGFHLDPTTGDLLFRPTQVNQIAIVVIEVKEWRLVNGVMEVVGITRRDMQIIVVACPNNNVPKILPPYSKQACAGQQVCLTITTDDDDNSDTVRISWNKGIKGATFTNNNGTVKHPTGQVCWTPKESDVSNIPYTFTVTARDDACPLAGQSVRAFSIFVRETPDATLKPTLLTCGRVAIHHSPKKQYPGGYTFNYVVRDSMNKPVWSSTNQSDTAFLQPGKHTIFLSMRTSTPCINIITDTIVVPNFVSVSVPSDTILCDGTPIMINSTTKFGNAPYDYEWRQVGAADSVLSTSTSIVVNGDSTSRYVVRVLDNNGCRNWDTVSVNWRALPAVTLGPDQRVCKGTMVTLDGGTDGVILEYLWKTGDTTRTVYVQDSNNYWVRITDTFGCSNADTMFFRVNNPRPELGSNLFRCERDTVVMTATGTDTYAWYYKDTYNPNSPGTPLGSGPSYSYIVTQTRSFMVRGTQTYMGVTCSNLDSVTINMNPLPTIVFNPQGPHCVDAGPISMLSYLVFPTSFTGTFRSDVNSSFVQSGMFYPNLSGPSTNTSQHPVIYRITDQNGCTRESTTIVRVLDLPKVNFVDTVAVCGDAVDLSFHQAGIQLEHNPVIGTGAPTWSSLTGNPIVENNIIRTPTQDQKLRVSALPQGAVYGLLYSFRSNATGCTKKDTLYVRVKTVPNTDAGSLPPVCWNGPLVDLNTTSNASPAGGVWSSSDITLVGSGTSYVPKDVGAAGKFVLPGSNVTFRYTVTQEGCSKSDDVVGLIKGIPNVQLTQLAGICEDSTAVDLTNRGTPYSLGQGIWTGNGVTSNKFDPIAAGIGFHRLVYRYTNPSNQCVNADSFITEVQAKPTLTFTSPKAACAGESFELKVTVDNSPGILWSRIGDGEFDALGSGKSTSLNLNTTYFPGPVDIDNVGFRILGETTNPRFCQPARLNQQVGIFPIPNVEIVQPINDCAPWEHSFDAITDALPGYWLKWTFGDGTEVFGQNNPNVAHTYPDPNTYTVGLEIHSDSAYGYCQNIADPIQVVVWPTPVAKMDANRWTTTVALPGVQFMDKSTINGGGTIDTWEWTFGDRNNSTSNQQHPFFEYPTSEPTDTGNFLVTLRVVSADGCPSETTGYLRIGPDITVFIPNAFTPNNFGEMRNDRFFVVADGFETFQITIFTRWGEKVYQSANINDGWDGKYKGMEAQQDVYVYVVRVTSLAGKEFEYYGTITLLR